MSDAWFTERCVRNEALVSSGELRLEIAKAISRTVDGDEEVMVRESSWRMNSDFLVSRNERERTVQGKFERKCEHTDLTMIQGGDVREVVTGGVHQHASVEGESIVGGAYNANYVGSFMRITAFCDFLAWGLWTELDATRVEASMVALRVYMGYMHNVGVKMQMAGHIFDDWVQRTENFGILVDNQLAAQRLGGVGSGVEAHM